ncbi:Asp23/Gls24 family envelope stress response protein [Haloactinomyces albus]|uniref:Alkaline shock family protein YloU n=1 Tax=Haloactinomyces albus TaxID=1352928 RepID=A0AAE4CQY8_9ACTN|nr:Asp23/Gls24 family envelope stress response protein [Haloactinomyces albus]MDR7303193.1 putative alkaline shock family protein YloU [Haloactinomyces albus]
MSSAVDPALDAPDDSPPERSDQTEQAERGRLTIDRAVLRKIAEHAADGVSGIVRVRRRIAGVGFGEHGASARLSGPESELRVRLDLALRYPTPVGETMRLVRERVHEELSRIADCHVRSIDVTISALVPDAPAPRVE